MTYTEEVVHYFETLIPSRVVDGRDVGYHSKLGCRVILQERHDRKDASGRDVYGQLILPDGELLNVFG